MTDDRFFERHGPFTLAALAEHAGAKLSPEARGDLLVRGIAPLESAEGDEVSVFCDARHAEAFASCRAGAVITSTKLSEHHHDCTPLLLAKDPRYAFAMIGLMFYPRSVVPGVHPDAVVDATAVIGDGCRIEAGAVIGPFARLGVGCHVGGNAVLGASVEIGDGTVVGNNVSISHALIGARVRIGAGAVIGGEGFGVVAGPSGLLCSAQLGRVIVGDDVRIGGNCTIDRGAVGDTIIGAGTVLDNLIQIAHNVQIGRCCIFAAQTGVAGSTKIGDGCVIGGQVAIADHLVIGARVRMAARSGVMRDVPEGQTIAGTPAVPVRQWHRQTVALEKAARRSVLDD